MALEIETKDCTALSDAEISEMAELVTGENVHFDVGHLSKQRDAWVLITHVRDGAKLAALRFLHARAGRRRPDSADGRRRYTPFGSP